MQWIYFKEVGISGYDVRMSMDFIPAGKILGDKIENRKNVDGE